MLFIRSYFFFIYGAQICMCQAAQFFYEHCYFDAAESSKMRTAYCNPLRLDSDRSWVPKESQPQKYRTTLCLAWQVKDILEDKPSVANLFTDGFPMFLWYLILARLIVQWVMVFVEIVINLFKL